MFASLKNKIKEETGSDISRKFVFRPRSPKLSASTSEFEENKSMTVNYVQEDNDHEIKLENNISIREKELLSQIDRIEKDYALLLEKKERQCSIQLEEKDREWQEKVTSLQNSMQAAQAVWSGEAAAARREAREEVRKVATLNEQLVTATASAARVQDRLDGIMEEIEVERRNWTSERMRLAIAAEDALHRLSLVETSTSDDVESTDATSIESALRRKLEEAQLHLHDIKTSWSGQIAALETQVGRLSRQAGEEGAERRRIEEQRDSLMERLREKEIELEEAQVLLEDKEAKMALLAAEVGDIARVGREARGEALHHRDVAESLTQKVSEVEKKLSTIEKLYESLKAENTSLNESNKSLTHEKELLLADKETLIQLDKKLKGDITEQKFVLDDVKVKLEIETKKYEDVNKANNNLEEIIENLKKELNEIHDRCDRERRDKDDALMRNAHMSQKLEMYRQEMRQQDTDVMEFKDKIASLQKSIAQNLEEQNALLCFRDEEQRYQAEIELLKTERDNAISSEKQLQDCIKDLNNQLSEKSKNIRVLQNRLTDMRKTLQRELRGGQVDPLGSSVVEGSTEDPDVSKKYLKHVLIKFLTSREIEARQLTKAVGALLGLSEQEESLLRETLGWRNGFTAWLAPPPKFPHS